MERKIFAFLTLFFSVTIANAEYKEVKELFNSLENDLRTNHVSLQNSQADEIITKLKKFVLESKKDPSFAASFEQCIYSFEKCIEIGCSSISQLINTLKKDPQQIASSKASEKLRKLIANPSDIKSIGSSANACLVGFVDRHPLFSKIVGAYCAYKVVNYTYKRIHKFQRDKKY